MDGDNTRLMNLQGDGRCGLEEYIQKYIYQNVDKKKRSHF